MTWWWWAEASADWPPRTFSASWAAPTARVLILDNHDDFGGHAKRNEFQANRRLLGYGGTYAIESPAPYSAVAKGLIAELGIDVSSYPRYVQRDLYSSRGLVPQDLLRPGKFWG